MSPRWSQQTKLIVTIGGLLGMVWLVYRFSSILIPTVVALILTYLLNIPVGLIVRRSGLSRTAVTAFLFLLIIALLVSGSVLLAPRLVRATMALGTSLQTLNTNLTSLFEKPIAIPALGYELQLSSQFDQAFSSLQNLIQPLASGAVDVVFNVAAGLVYLVLTLVLSFYLVKDTPRISQYISQRIPTDYRSEIDVLWQELAAIWRAFFQGQVILAFVIGIAVWITMSIVGLPSALALGVIAGVMEVVPNIGPVLAAIPGVLVALIGGSSRLPMSNNGFAVLVVILYIVIQQLENHFIVPRVIGGRVHLHPVVVILGALAGAQLAGVLGIFLAAPVIGSARVLGGYLLAKLLDMEPFAKPEVWIPTPHRQQLGGHPVRGILFDLDGTLAETDDDLVQAWSARLQPVRWLFAGRDTERAARRLLVTLEGPLNRLLTLLDALRLDRRAFSLYHRILRWRGADNVHEFHPVEGTPNLLRSLAGRYRLALVTSRGGAEVTSYLQQSGLGDCFAVVVTRDSAPRMKPHPQPVYQAAEMLGIVVGQCVLIGDTQADVRAAKSAGALAIGVLSGLGEESDLEEADLIIDSVVQLTDWL